MHTSCQDVIFGEIYFHKNSNFYDLDYRTHNDGSIFDLIDDVSPRGWCDTWIRLFSAVNTSWTFSAREYVLNRDISVRESENKIFPALICESRWKQIIVKTHNWTS